LELQVFDASETASEHGPWIERRAEAKETRGFGGRETMPTRASQLACRVPCFANTFNASEDAQTSDTLNHAIEQWIWQLHPRGSRQCTGPEGNVGDRIQELWRALGVTDEFVKQFFSC
jgi:hypothetical protein